MHPYKFKQLLAFRSRVVLPSSVTSRLPLVEVLDSEDGGNPLLRKAGNFTSRQAVTCQET